MTYFRTIDSLVFRQLGLKRDVMMQYSHYRDLGRHTGHNFRFKENLDGGNYGMAKADRMLFLEGLARSRQQPLKDAWSDAGETDISWGELEYLANSLAAYKAANGMVDFPDIRQQFVSGRPTIPTFDALLIDEMQDLSFLQHRVVEKLAANAKRVYCAGDDDQCSVEGTLVATTHHGDVPVECLDPRKHSLLAFNLRCHQMTGERKGCHFEIVSRPIDEEVIAVTAAGKTSTGTLHHIWVCRWTQEAKLPETSAVYIMRQGSKYRVGWCQLFEKHGGRFHLGARCAAEHADAAWILRVFDNRGDASAYESIVAARYGLPMCMFVTKGATSPLYTQDRLDAIFTEIGDISARVSKCLSDHGRLTEYPLWQPGAANTFGAKTFTPVGCNLLERYMSVPVVDKQNSPGVSGVLWHPITLDRSCYRGLVFSLNVEKYHTYIADGIVTHNCIFKWAGADVDAFLSVKGTYQVLGQSYRVPRSGHQIAAKIAARISRRQEKPWKSRDEEGTAQWVQNPESVDLSAAPGWAEYRAANPHAYEWLLLARNGYMLEQLETLCRSQGFAYESVSTNPRDGGALKALVSWEAMRQGKAITKPAAENVLKFISPGRIPARVRQQIEDTHQRGSVVLTSATSPPWMEALDRISDADREYFIAAYKRGEKLISQPRIRIATVHTAKGSEATNVLLMSDMSQRTALEMQKDPDSEHRVWYVAATRHRKNLHVVMPANAVNSYQVM